MSKTEVFSTQVADHHGALPQWEHTLVSVGERLSPLLPERTIAQVLPMVTPEFKGALECGALGETVLFKITATPFFFRSSPRGEKSGALPLLLCSQLSGETHVKQQNWAATLRSQDWCLLDTRFLHEARWVAPRNEMLILGLDPPSGREGRGLLERALGHRWNGQTGISRVLQATLKETFRQLDRLDVSNGRAITRAISVMTWDALREQLEAPHGLKPQDRRQSQVKEYIELHLADPELSNETIAHACAVSVRSLQRSFAADSSGSTSNYIWARRLSRCAAALRDPGQLDRPITDICLSLGFNSTSHFSRIFKKQFGVTPSLYRSSLHGPAAP